MYMPENALRNLFHAPRGESISDSESSRSPSTTAQPDTPKPLQDNMMPQISIFQGRAAEYSPSVNPLDEQEYDYDMDKLFDNNVLLTAEYHCLTEQVRQPAINIAGSSLNFANTSNRGVTTLQGTPLFHFVMPPYGEISHDYPLLNNLNTSSMEELERAMVYPQHSQQSQQQMPIAVQQASNHGVEDYSSPALIKPEPWFGFESLFI
ncbi:hypothetical protein MKX08_008332 [Trichoderma sp. CBMAI-0020]|nr:hypothetical protein MKX08_008332 [Trichoderma sp. CBMAI-0020]